MSNTKISQILTRLLSDQKLTVSELARRIQLPQPTIQRIATGVCENPHISSLKPIAEFFSISVDQLKGLEPIPKFDKIFKLPLISWIEAAQWNQYLKTNSKENILIDIPINEHAYALRLLDGAMEPVFPCETLLIVDPSIHPKDRSYVITLIKNAKIPIFRQLIMNGGEKYLKPLSPNTDIYKMTQLKKGDNIIGTVVQTRWNYTG